MRKITAKELRSMIKEELERVSEQAQVLPASMAQAASDAGKMMYQPRRGEPTHVNRNDDLHAAVKRKVKAAVERNNLSGEARIEFDLGVDAGRDLYTIGNVSVVDNKDWKAGIEGSLPGFVPRDLKPSNNDAEPGYYYYVVRTVG